MSNQSCENSPKSSQISDSFPIVNQSILILGGTGSLGNQLTKTLIKHNSIYIYARNELKIWEMKKRYPQAYYIVGDLRDKRSISDTLLEIKPSIIIIALALKHVDVCESFINQSVDINFQSIDNILNLIYTWYKQGADMTWLDTVLYTSTDKAVEPITVYGMCKSITERSMLEMSKKIDKMQIKFVTTRYGNVFTSNGSLYNVFENIAHDPEKKAFTVTDPDMTRFYMTLEQSVELILNAIVNGRSGQIWIPKLSSFKIIDLARYYSRKYNKPIEFIGLRGIEKIHEKLISFHEEKDTCLFQNNYVIDPYSKYWSESKDKVNVKNYSSENTLEEYDFEKCIANVKH